MVHLIALDALTTAGAIQRGGLKGEALVSTRLAHVLITVVNRRQVRLPYTQENPSGIQTQYIAYKPFPPLLSSGVGWGGVG